MYGANLSWKPLQKILKALVAQELIEESVAEGGDKRTKTSYGLTEKGVNVLRYFNKAKELVDMETEIRGWR
jgi:predicted transcriptional regulator